MRIALFFISCFILSFGLIAQEKDAYWIHFKDKNEQVNLLDRPSVFLSEQAISRRNLQGIPIDHSDLPVSEIYLTAVRGLGIHTVFASRWFNMVSVLMNEEDIRNLKQLEFISEITKQHGFKKNDRVENVFVSDFDTSLILVDEYYGFAINQIKMLSGIDLHNLDYKGQGMTIAVLDAGFNSADILPVFENAWNANRIKIGPDFVRGNDTLVDFSHSNHGTFVLGFMASELENMYVGTAPLADYVLIRTENAPTENIVEEHCWLAGAEYADSLGVDLINSSLGYTTFDDSLQNHTYEDLDGNTTLITNAADMAASKGILVVNSAGNSGARAWHYISAPADADSVLTVGSVDGLGVSSPFSSHGPTADNRIKPNVAAHGQNIFTISIDSAFYPSQGTSFSAPVITGMAACLWQYKRDSVAVSIGNMDIISLIENSSSLFPFSNPDLGFGIPNFELASALLSLNEFDQGFVEVFPNPFKNNIHVEMDKQGIFAYQLVDLYGRIIFQDRMEEAVRVLDIQIPSTVSRGNYLLTIETANGSIVKKLIK